MNPDRALLPIGLAGKPSKPRAQQCASDILAEMRCLAFAALVPPPQIPLSEWIEAKSSSCPRAYAPVRGRCAFIRYQREIADAIGDPEIERVTLQKAARIGFSALLAAAIGNYCLNDPTPILAVQPTQDDCRDFVVSDLEPMFKASPRSRGSSAMRRGPASAARPATPS